MPSKLFAAATFTSLLFVACSDSGGSGSGAGSDSGTGTGTDGGSTTTTFTCCIGTDEFSCETDEAAQACGQGSPGTCKKSGSCGSSKPDAGGTSGGAIGDTCSFDNDCESNICVKKTGASEGVCSKTCDATLDCPSLWTCAPVAGRSGDHCIPVP